MTPAALREEILQLVRDRVREALQPVVRAEVREYFLEQLAAAPIAEAALRPRRSLSAERPEACSVRPSVRPSVAFSGTSPAPRGGRRD